MKTAMRILTLTLLASLAVFITNCSSEQDAQQASFYMTDAPIDDAQVRSVFVTVTDVRLDGKSVASFSGKKTLDIKALQNGQTQLIGTAELDAKAYQNLEIVLDLATDASGNAPGCYVETVDNVKHDLAENISGSTRTITTAGVEVREFAENKFVIDFDLRKAIKAAASGASEYNFVSESELNAAVRTVVEEEAGTIEGDLDNTLVNYDKVIVYAYEQGTFNENTETTGQGSGNVHFSNAITSASASQNGNFALHFLYEGTYELHFAAYEEQGDGSFSLQGMIQLQTAVGLDLNAISVSAQSETMVEAEIIGLL